MKKFVKFMVDGPGRALRIVAGLILILCGYLVFSAPNWVMIIIGLVPLGAGIFDFCLLAPLFGYYFSGKKTREALYRND